MKNLGLILLSLILSVLLGLLGTKVILSVSTLFGLTFLVELGFLKLYGLLSIIQLVLYKDKSLDDDLSEDERVKKFFKIVIMKLFVYLIFWGVSFLMYCILK